MATKAAAKKANVAPVQPAQVYYRINSLLHTLRTIAQREDQLCILTHHLRTSGKLNAALTAELHEILEEIPADEYMQDLHALKQSLETAEGAPQGTAKTSRARGTTKRRAA